MNLTINQLLERQQKEWEIAEIPKDEFTLIPTGTYQAMLEDLKIVAINKGGEEILKLKWTFKIISDTCKNRLAFVNDDLIATSERLKYTKKNLKIAGVELKELKDIVNVIPDIQGKFFELYIAKKMYNDKEYNNCYINKEIKFGSEKDFFNNLEENYHKDNDIPEVNFDQKEPF